MGTVGAVCQARHCQSHTLPSSTGAGQAASCLPAGVPWDGRGPVGSCYSWWPERLVCFLERRVSLQLMPFVPPGLCSWVSRMGWGKVCGRSIQSWCFKWPFPQMCQFPYSQGLSQAGITGIYNPLPAELLGNVSIFCNMHNCQLPNPEQAHVLSTWSLQQREHT